MSLTRACSLWQTQSWRAHEFEQRPDGLWVDNGEMTSVNLDGSGRSTITNSGGQISELMILGTEVWFTTGQDGNYEVYKMSADGSAQRNMTNNPHADRLDINVP